MGKRDYYPRTIISNLDTSESTRRAAKLSKLGIHIKQQNSRLEQLDEKWSQQWSERHNTFDSLGQQTRVEFTVGFAKIRDRFLSTYRRDFMSDKSVENQRIISHGNISAHGGHMKADASLYQMQGNSIDADGKVRLTL
ncbi:hypothetical protein AbraIFM66951_001100 [Aspergillus brasiliensis]|uniref:Uncharacterized protein n=1 Tax=Aspergillus brasiliensis TaxID=319629 RepID=A0A9W5YLJ9_9EURO|nr:hypothetical protein AbraCBS73388_010095 [Aspergillus brasiliensis]GKZ48858.1 hypothetical protein AbraIFM66951_001100 [Aspergillus brasiliensis]